MSDYSVIDLCTIISIAITCIGAIYKLSEYLKYKLKRLIFVLIFSSQEIPGL